ncbi:hypothetical protein [Corynebacterium ulceribovis]|uniref:hypothetical protein n=1 Tax=Corynebacterium ulceribovis TaxID=487732 RepID=UPI00036BFBFE|nr:hypothetical protein [Corynebacterium ulceribovis]
MIEATRSQRVLGSMSFGLAAVGFATALKGVSYFPPLKEPTRAPSHWLEHFIEMPVIGFAWLAIGLLCFVAIPKRRLRSTAWGLVMVLHAAWMMSFAMNWVLYQGRAWVSALSYFTIVALIFWGLARQNREVTEL